MADKKVVVYIAQQAIEGLGKTKCYVNATPSQNRSKATVVVSDEGVFTESEVRAVLQKMEEEAEANMRTSVQFPGHLDGYDADEWHDVEDDDEVIIGYECLGCGHTQATDGWGGRCDRCDGLSLEAMYY